MRNLNVVIKLVPLPEVEEEVFEKFMKEEVLPDINMGPTRGGQIVRQSLLKKDFRMCRGYLWEISLENASGHWFEDEIESVSRKLKSKGIPLSFDIFELVESISAHQ